MDARALLAFAATLVDQYDLPDPNGPYGYADPERCGCDKCPEMQHAAPGDVCRCTVCGTWWHRPEVGHYGPISKTMAGMLALAHMSREEIFESFERAARAMEVDGAHSTTRERRWPREPR